VWFLAVLIIVAGIGKVLLENELVCETTHGSFQPESVVLPIIFFGGEAEGVKNCQQGYLLVVGAHLYGTQFRTEDGAVRRGVQIIVDQVLQGTTQQKEVFE
jgi:single-stranded DNA-binding protein